MRSRIIHGHVAILVLLGALLTSCAVRSESSLMRKPNKVTLEQAQSRLQRSTKPVERTKAYVQISDILLRYVHTSVPNDDIDQLTDCLQQYQDAILSARQTMVASGRDAQRDPEGFKDLEVVLRQHVRWLGDWRRGLPDNQRKPLDDAMETADAVRQEMLELLFAVQNAP
jgi:hypothetical protein